MLFPSCDEKKFQLAHEMRRSLKLHVIFFSYSVDQCHAGSFTDPSKICTSCYKRGFSCHLSKFFEGFVVFMFS